MVAAPLPQQIDEGAKQLVEVAALQLAAGGTGQLRQRGVGPYQAVVGIDQRQPHRGAVKHQPRHHRGVMGDLAGGGRLQQRRRAQAR